MSRPVVIAFALLVLGGCKSSPPPIEHTERPRNPVQVSWQEVRRGASKAELVARVQRLTALSFPLEVTIALPEGVTLAAGRARFTLPPNAEGTTHDEAVTLAYEKTPAGDAELRADGAAADVGVHARMAYRFGRPGPKSEVVAPGGPDLKAGDRNLGPSVPISPQ